LRVELTEPLLDASPEPPYGHDDAGTESSNPLPSSAESSTNRSRRVWEERTVLIQPIVNFLHRHSAGEGERFSFFAASRLRDRAVPRKR
jgi:hypothetical protein